ncbi:MAG TPA: peptidoglycan bridge formation glycyltransferase FemA/FemB family protein [Chloroflexota bacterium]|nr:peptidoglycan bridge formation glycyltransferase FemA/FemB family protein [Chloroflexota bacterium]
MTHDTLLVHDRDAWNDFVAASCSGHILQTWEWGEIKRYSGWEPFRLALRDGSKIQAAAQVLVRWLPYGVGRLAYVPRGPVLDYADDDLTVAVLSALRDLAAETRVIAVKLEPDVVEPSPLPERLAGLGLVPAPPVQMRSSIWVDLTASEEEMLARQKQKTRYNVRLAERKGVVVREGMLSDLDAWYDLYRITSQRDGFTVHDRSYYRLILETLQPRGMATLLLAHHEGDLLAGIIVFSFGPQAQYMYGASGNEKRNLMAPYLLQWCGMLWARARGAEVYDLWGIPDRLDEGEDLWGVYRHKRGYGGEVVRYIGAFDLIRAPLQHLALERVARPLFKKVTRLSV